MMFKEFFSKQLYIARLRTGYTQKQIAEKADISVRWYQRIENGYSTPGGELVVKLMIILNIDKECFKDYFRMNRII